jgi:glycosyltransferase involved in cell wall biosynthesis
MSERPLRIFQVSTRDRMGGAEKVAHTLFRGLRARGHDARLVVGTAVTDDPDVVELPHGRGRGPWYAAWQGLRARLDPSRGAARRRAWRAAGWLGEPARFADWLRGVEDFRFPGTRALLEDAPDVIHCHNLHGGYFDLRLLPAISRATPTILTLHDTWLLAGHCAYSLDCERWRTGCGRCPRLDLYPSIRRDATALNWERKRRIYERSRIYLTAPCRWALNRAMASPMLWPAVVDARVIEYGLDLKVFRPADRAAARADVGLPPRAKVLLFAANGVRQNPYKDFQTLKAAVARVADAWAARADADGTPIVFVALGDHAPPERVGSAEVRFVPFQNDPARVARYYQAADVYVHAARADTFPNTILEALACGTPVVATGVCGIPEQVRNLEDNGEETATGILVAAGDDAALAAGVTRLLSNDALRARLSENAAADARRRFDVHHQCDRHVEWYREIVAAHAGRQTQTQGTSPG